MNRRTLVLPAFAVIAIGLAYGPDLWRRLYDPVKEYCEMYLRSGWAVAFPILGAVAAAGVVGGAARLMLHVRSDVLLNRKLRERAIPVPPVLKRAAAAAGLGAPVACFKDAAPLAFCRGITRPRVYVSTGLVHLLNEDELAIVLVHEGAHARGFHPLRALSVRLLAGTTFFLPIARAAEQRFLLSLEFAADRRAAEISLPDLASALLKVLEAPRASSPFTQAALAFNPTEERIRRLTADRADRGTGRPWLSQLARPLAWSAAASLLVLGVAGLSVPIVNTIRGCPLTIG